MPVGLALVCPVRGRLKAKAKSKDGLMPSDERFRVEAIRHLVARGYPKENIRVEAVLKRFGNSGRNSFRGDIVVLDQPVSSLADDVDTLLQHAPILAEVKRDNADAAKGLAYQVKPMLDFAVRDDCVALYWDDVQQRVYWRTRTGTQRRRGWDLPQRAKHFAGPGDIYVASIWGSARKWFLVGEGSGGLVVTNGMHRLRMQEGEEHTLLDLVVGLCSEAYAVQMRSLARGSDGLAEINPDVAALVVLPCITNMRVRTEVKPFLDQLQVGFTTVAAKVASFMEGNKLPLPNPSMRPDHTSIVYEASTMRECSGTGVKPYGRSRASSSLNLMPRWQQHTRPSVRHISGAVLTPTHAAPSVSSHRAGAVAECFGSEPRWACTNPTSIFSSLDAVYESPTSATVGAARYGHHISERGDELAMVPSVDLERIAADAESLLQRLRTTETRCAYVIEFAGSPKAGKSTTIDTVQHFFKRMNYKVWAPTEGASKRTPYHLRRDLVAYNAWTLNYAISELLAAFFNQDPYDLILLDRGPFDSLAWMSLQRSKGNLSNDEFDIIREFALHPKWVDLIDLVFLFTSNPEISLARENSSKLTTRGGTAMNPETLSEILREYTDLRDSLRQTYPVESVDTSRPDGSPQDTAFQCSNDIIEKWNQKLNMREATR